MSRTCPHNPEAAQPKGRDALMVPVLRAQSLTIDSADSLGIAVYLRRLRLKLTQQRVADRVSLGRGKISQFERGCGSVAPFGTVLLIVNAPNTDHRTRQIHKEPDRSTLGAGGTQKR